MECGKCGKPDASLLCIDCVKTEVEDEGSANAGRLDGFNTRLTEIEGELVRIQGKLMAMR